AESFLKIVTNRQFRRMFGTVSGEKLSRVPRGFRPDHPAAEYLKHKQFLASRTFPCAAATMPSFYGIVLDTFRAMLPLIRFLNERMVRGGGVRDGRDVFLRDGVERGITSK